MAGAARSGLDGPGGGAGSGHGRGAADGLVRGGQKGGQGVQQVAANANRFEEKTGVALDRFTVAVAPVTTVVTKLASQIELKSGELADKIAGTATIAKRVSPFKKARAQKAA